MDILIKRFCDAGYFLEPNSALGLLQYYGLPTAVLDFTNALQSAFAFAGFGDTNVGRVAVLSVKQYLWGGRGGFGLVDMSRHKWAERAQRQDAFGLVMLNRLDDLKSDAVKEKPQPSKELAGTTEPGAADPGRSFPVWRAAPALCRLAGINLRYRTRIALI